MTKTFSMHIKGIQELSARKELCFVLKLFFLFPIIFVSTTINATSGIVNNYHFIATSLSDEGKKKAFDFLKGLIGCTVAPSHSSEGKWNFKSYATTRSFYSEVRGFRHFYFWENSMCEKNLHELLNPSRERNHLYFFFDSKDNKEIISFYRKYDDVFTDKKKNVEIKTKAGERKKGKDFMLDKCLPVPEYFNESEVKSVVFLVNTRTSSGSTETDNETKAYTRDLEVKENERKKEVRIKIILYNENSKNEKSILRDVLNGFKLCDSVRNSIEKTLYSKNEETVNNIIYLSFFMSLLVYFINGKGSRRNINSQMKKKKSISKRKRSKRRSF